MIEMINKETRSLGIEIDIDKTWEENGTKMGK